MLPKQNRMCYMFFALLGVFGFLKVYQHNLMIKVSYQKQRLERRRHLLEKERNDLYAQLITMQSPEHLALQAHKEHGMQPLAVDQLIITGQGEAFDFSVTSTGSYKHAALHQNLVMLAEASHVSS